jgi:hypothetical protein
MRQACYPLHHDVRSYVIDRQEDGGGEINSAQTHYNHGLSLIMRMVPIDFYETIYSYLSSKIPGCRPIPVCSLSINFNTVT